MKLLSRLCAGTRGLAGAAFVSLSVVLTPSFATADVARAERPIAEFDFDGDGRTDIATISPSQGALRWDIRRSSGGATRVTFGRNNADVPTPGDFDGDGRTDIAVWRPGKPSLLLVRASDSTFQTTSFGTSGDRPLVGDTNGDGKDELIVTRVSGRALTFLMPRGAGVTTIVFGRAGDLPFLSDLDGDGADDVSVVRADATGSWVRYTRFADGSVRQRAFGVAATDFVIPACDVDGDGRADDVIWRGGATKKLGAAPWMVSRRDAIEVTPFGIGGRGQDRPTPGDYDGDGRCDFGVFRPSTSTWYVQLSASGATEITRWGGFLPIPRIGVM